MAKILFRCPNCSHGLAIEGEAVGSPAECTECGWRVVVPIPGVEWKCPSCSTVLSSSRVGETFGCPSCGTSVKVPDAVAGNPRLHIGKRCPSCNANMVADAVICISCGHDVRTGSKHGTMQASRGVVPASLSRRSPEEKISPFFWPKMLAMLLAAVGIAVYLMWWKPMNEKNNTFAQALDVGNKGHPTPETITALENAIRRYPDDERVRKLSSILVQLQETKKRQENDQRKIDALAAIRLTNHQDFLLAKAAVTNDLQRMSVLIDKACSGEPENQYLLGKELLDGKNIRFNENQAIRWLERSASNGIVNAQFCLGMVLSYASGGNRAPIQGAMYLKRAADNGHRDAQFQYALTQLVPTGGSPDVAVAYLSNAADQGHIEAQRILGQCYFQGIGVAKNPAKAAGWWTKASERGDTFARTSLGSCYLYGCGVGRDRARGMELLLKSAEQEDDVAQQVLGASYYEEGSGKGLDSALYWLAKAAEKGNGSAKQMLSSLKKQLANEAFSMCQSNNCNFGAADDDDTRALAKTVVTMKARTKFPNKKECHSLLESCQRLIARDLKPQSRRAVIGLRLFLEHENAMLDKGFERYGGVFMDQASIARARLSVQERMRTIAEWKAREDGETERMIKEFGSWEKADQHAQALNKSLGHLYRYFVKQNGDHWYVYAEINERFSRTSGDAYGATQQQELDAQAWNQRMDAIANREIESNPATRR